MKKSVRIRKALPGETPGYYNKTAKFLDKALPKAKMGMQVGNGIQDKLQVIMLDTYSTLRDGGDPQEVFRKLLMEYGMPQEMAYKVMQTVMQKLAQDGYADPASLQQDEEDDWDAAGQAQQPQQGEAEQAVVPNQNPGTPDEDEELALSEAEEDTGYDAMEHYNNRNVEQEEQEEAFKYGGYFNDGGEYDNYFSDEESPEDTVIDQYSNPGQLSMEQKAPMSIEAMLQSFNLPNSRLETPDLNAYLQGMYNYQNVGTEGIPNDLLPTSKHGGAHISLPLASGGRSTGPGGPGKKGRRKKNKEKETTTTGTTGTETRVEPTITIEPQETTVAPTILQNLQNAYYQKNAVAPQRGTFGTAAQILGTGLNYLRPTNWAESSKAFGLIGGREGVAPSTTATKTYEDIYKMLRDPDYKPETLIDNGDKTYSSGLAFNMGPQLYETLIESANNPRIREQLQKSGQVQLELPTSKVPELNFLSLHNENNNTRLRLSLDNDGALKASLVTFIDTPLKGTKSKNVVIKDEFFIDPENKSIIDPKTGMPLEMIQKSYYKGNELNWYNQSGTLPFTKKYGSGFDFTGYPEVVSSEPLKQTPGSRWNAAWNMIGKPLFGTPYVLPFTYPGFAAKNKFYPNAGKVTVDYFGRQRELGPQAPGGMTFGDQPFATQYADYNLQANRNYLTGRNFMIGAGLLGAGIGGATFYYNRDKDDFEVGTEGTPTQGYQPYIDSSYSGAGRSFDTTGFGIKLPLTGGSLFKKDSMYVSPQGDTIHDKGWGVPIDPNYKDGGAHKKKFLKRMSQMFEPGGEAQDPSLGKGNRMDDNNQVAKKKNNFVNILKRQSDKAANEELYDLVQKSGDPKLMNIFMGDEQQEQPQDDQMMQQPQFTEMGGYVNMDTDNPLTRFVYGGYDDAPAYYESDVLPEASNGIEITNKAGENRMVADVMPFDEWAEGERDDFATTHPGVDFDTWKAGDESGDDYQDYASFHHKSLNEYQDYGTPISTPSLNFNPTTNNTHNCPPGSLWVEKYQQCVPIMQIKLNPRIVSGDPGLHNIFLPWNPILKTRGYKMKYGDKLTLKDLQKYAGKPLGDPYATLTYRKHMLAPKRQLDIWNPDGKLSEADMRALMDYGVGKGWNKKGSKNKSSKNKSSNANFKSRGSNKNTSNLSKREQLDADIKKRYGYSDQEWENTDKRGKRRERIAERYEQGRGMRYKTNEAYENFKDSSFGQQMKATGDWYADKAKKIIKPFIKKK